MTWFLVAALTLGLLLVLIALSQVTKHLTTNYPRVMFSLTTPISKALSMRLNQNQVVGTGDVSINKEAIKAVNAGPAMSQESESVITPEEQANLDERERSMIRSILRLDEFNARDIMVPRLDIVTVDVEDSLADVASRMLESGHSRLPVYRETIDNIVGVIHSRDLLQLLNSNSRWPSLADLLRAPFFVPEAKRLDELLSEFQKLRVHMALVVDEHGGIEGLVTLEDLLEEIVGEIEDEFSTLEEPQITSDDNGAFIVDGRTSLNNLSEIIPMRFDEAEIHTIGGLVYSKLGKMPQTGDEVEHDGLRIKVLSMVGRRIRKLRLVSECTPD